VPRAKLACGRVGDDVDGMAVQPGRPALRLLSRSVACIGRQLVHLHGAGNRPPRVVLEAFVPPARAACHGPRLSRSRGELMQGRDFSCETETCRARRRLVRGGSPRRELVGDATI
jgi:hypothetical protein